MARFISSYKHYVILDLGNELLVKNTKGRKENHSHFSKHKDRRGNINLGAIYKCIRLVEDKRCDMTSPYMFRSVIRLTLDSKHKDNLQRIYDRKFKDRQNYFNPNKGVRRK